MHWKFKTLQPVYLPSLVSSLFSYPLILYSYLFYSISLFISIPPLFPAQWHVTFSSPTQMCENKENGRNKAQFPKLLHGSQVNGQDFSPGSAWAKFKSIVHLASERDFKWQPPSYQTTCCFGAFGGLDMIFAILMSGGRARISGEQRTEGRALSLGRQGGGETRQNHGFSKAGWLSFPPSSPSLLPLSMCSFPPDPGMSRAVHSEV